MIKLFLKLTCLLLIASTFTSCASLFTKSSHTVDFKGVPGTTIIETGKNKQIATIGDNGFAQAKIRKSLKGKTLLATKPDYQSQYYELGTRVQGWFWGNIILGGIPGMLIDVATGKMMKYNQDFIDVTLMPLEKSEETAFVEVVNPEEPGLSNMEKTIIRWFFDSDPRGARIFYRVISSVPNEVKNTNETYMTTTPLEETRSFNIPGLTYDNAKDVTIEIKVTKKGFEDQVKRFNIRQALDQQEISSFFELVEKVR